jgi:hypothetical protein
MRVPKPLIVRSLGAQVCRQCASFPSRGKDPLGDVGPWPLPRSINSTILTSSKRRIAVSPEILSFSRIFLLFFVSNAPSGFTSIDFGMAWLLMILCEIALDRQYRPSGPAISRCLAIRKRHRLYNLKALLSRMMRSSSIRSKPLGIIIWNSDLWHAGILPGGKLQLRLS